MHSTQTIKDSKSDSDTPKKDFAYFCHEVSTLLDECNKTTGKVEKNRERADNLFWLLVEDFLIPSAKNSINEESIIKQRNTYVFSSLPVSGRQINQPNFIIFFGEDKNSSNNPQTFHNKFVDNLKPHIEILSLSEYCNQLPPDITQEAYQEDYRTVISDFANIYVFDREVANRENTIYAIKIKIDDFFKLIWEPNLERARETLRFSGAHVSNYMQDLFAKVQINYRYTNSLFYFFLSDLIVKCREACYFDSFRPAIDGSRDPAGIIREYLTPIKQFTLDDAKRLEEAIPLIRGLQHDDNQYLVNSRDLYSTISEKEHINNNEILLKLFSQYFGNLVPNSVKESSKKNIGVCIHNKALLHGSFFKDVETAITNQPHLVTKFRERTFLRELIGELSILSNSYIKECKTLDDILEREQKKDDSTLSQCNTIGDLANYLNSEGLTSENPIRELIKRVRADDKKRLNQLESDAKEESQHPAHPYIKNASKRTKENLAKYQAHSKTLNETLNTLEKHLHIKFVQHVEEIPDERMLLAPY
jgi:hypothetical protein